MRFLNILLVLFQTVLCLSLMPFHEAQPRVISSLYIAIRKITTKDCWGLALTRGRQIQIILFSEVSLKIRLKYRVKILKMKLPQTGTVTSPAK